MKNSNLEIKVGFFVLAALLTAGFLVVSFGRFGDLFKTSYPMTIEFETASGIIKNSQVLYRGANVGTVASKPVIADGGKRVDLLVDINTDVQIDKKSRFVIGSYGLLGDRFVDVVPPDQPSGEYYQTGDRAKGSQNVGLGELAQELKPVIDRLETIITELDTGGIAEEASESVKKLNSILEKVDVLVAEAEDGEGAFHLIMKDPQVAADIKTSVHEVRLLSENLRKKGVLFYSDLSEKDKKDSREGSTIIQDRLR
ncbi:MAG: MlaD family protein [Verrucomicrobiota bacterium]